MREILRIARAIDALLDAGKRGVLVTVAGTRGSTYRRAGARCVIGEDGSAFGAISGGCVERDLGERARLWLEDMKPRVVTYDSSAADDIVFGLGLGCRGKIEMLIQPFDAQRRPSLPPSSGTYGTVIASGDDRYAAGDSYPVDGAETTCRMTFGDVDVLVEVVRPQRSIAIFGTGADVHPVATIATTLGWRVDVITAREVKVTGCDAAVVMTHNFLRDVEIVQMLLASNVAYIGLLGPKSRGEEILTQVGEADRSRIWSPVGLDLGGEAPEDIALAIVAEIQAVLNGMPAASLRDREGPIHGGGQAILPVRTGKIACPPQNR
ncbi:MAG TPA: XdhC family protein [Thermoanaerobaculia bacterium]|nr:XdhC family protein [Thermoanaerobaculia bacterium]